MNKKSITLLYSFLFGLSLLISACVGVPTETNSTPESVKPKADLTPGMVRSLEGVRSATIRIEAEGTFIEPEEEMAVTWAGSGSGFIIDPSGIAVTNNHVVTGAALIRVWVADETTPRNARILGVSECADLAVIDIEGLDLPYLEWHKGDVNVGLEVYAAGYPLGDPEFTLTKGIVSKAKADGESTWSSIDYVIEHDARINPGNSGGPLVDDQGRVVAVNYASIDSVDQYFAIKADDAIPVIDQLRRGKTVESIGVNGVAIEPTEDGLSGIWVYSVQSGSPADQAGIKGGDVIRSMEGLPLGKDGTMADYCDILRTHSDDAVLGLEVVRLETGEQFEGQINGRALEVTSTFGGRGSQVIDYSGTETYSDYKLISDDQGILQVEVPKDWDDVNGSSWLWGDEEMGPSVWASPDLAEFQNSWDVPGMIFNLTLNQSFFGGPVDYLDIQKEYLANECDFIGREKLNDGLFSGSFDGYENCGGGDTRYVIYASRITDNPQAMIILEVQMVSEEDINAAIRIFDSFSVDRTSSSGRASSDDNEGTGGAGNGYDSYVTVRDDYNSIVVEVPAEWDDINGAPWTFEDKILGAGISASTNLDDFYNEWGVSGMQFFVSDYIASQIGYMQLLAEASDYYMESCEFEGRYDYDDGVYRGKYDYFIRCGGSGGSSYTVLSAVSKTDQFSYLILVEIAIAKEADWEAWEHILSTFDVVGQLP